MSWKTLILPTKRTSTVDPNESRKIVNVGTIAASIEKAEKTLNICIVNQNIEAIATWERILASLRMKWRDAMVEVETNGNYTFDC